MEQLFRQFLRFAGVGGVAFVIDWGTMTFLAEVFGIHYMVSTTVGFIVSVVFNYVASMRYVFERKEGMSRKREFTVFVVLSVVGLGLNNLLMFLFAGVAQVDYRAAKVVATALVTIYNFTSRKKFLDAGTNAALEESDHFV